jgi:hypothetical protein
MRVSPDIQLITQQLEQLRRNGTSVPDKAKSFEALLGTKSLAVASDGETRPQNQNTAQREAPTRSVVSVSGVPPKPGSYIDIRV